MSASFRELPFEDLPWQNVRVCVVGDVMLDAYMWGKVNRVSPEAPVPVVEIERREQRVGGAGNVVKNLHALGAEVELIGVVGGDRAGADLATLLEPLCTALLVTDGSRPTTVKTRIISGGQHVVRVDEESTEPCAPDLTDKALAHLHALLASERKPDVVVIEDYDKGLLTPAFVDSLLSACKQAHVPVAVDPKLSNFHAYRGVALFKPNLKELNEGLGLRMPAHPSNPEAMAEAVEQLMEQLQCERLMVTLGEHGTWMHAPDEGVMHAHVPAIPREVLDVSGAGDTVVAVASLLLAASIDALSMAAVANLAGGWVCERVGVVPITKDALALELPMVQLPHLSSH